MNIKTKYKGKDVTITLTQDQLEEISKQVDERPKVEDLNYKSSLKLLEKNNINPDPKGLFGGLLLELITIIRATNFIDNDYKDWKPDFDNNSKYKYLPRFIKESSGWVFDTVDLWYYTSSTAAGFYFKESDSAKLIAEKYLKSHYNKIL